MTKEELKDVVFKHIEWLKHAEGFVPVMYPIIINFDDEQADRIQAMFETFLDISFKEDAAAKILNFTEDTLAEKACSFDKLWEEVENEQF